MARLVQIVSGGQTGVDQAALRAGLHCGLTIGGWCPPGRGCEAGVIPAHFPLRETPRERSPDAPEIPRSMRTEWNIRDSDATLILRPEDAGGDDPGTAWAARCARHHGRPVLTCDPTALDAAPRIRGWLDALPIETLNVAGPSEARCPGIGERAYALLCAVLRT